jgi:hypothetical protein
MLLPFVCACFEIWSKQDKDRKAKRDRKTKDGKNRDIKNISVKIKTDDKTKVDDKPGCCGALGGLCFLLYPISGNVQTHTRPKIKYCLLPLPLPTHKNHSYPKKCIAWKKQQNIRFYFR